MSITYSKDLSKISEEKLYKLYGETSGLYEVFAKSYLKVFAFEGEALVGAVRAISEGVETVLVIDLQTLPGVDREVEKRLVEALEAEILDRRVMLYGRREQLSVLEELGFGRCKNAWTYFKPHLQEADFLPPGYRYENEFLSYSKAAVNEPKETEIIYKDGYDKTSYEEINELLSKAFGGRAHDLNKTKAAFENSQYVVTAFANDKLVGVARAVSDKKFYATILNVAVDPEYQGLSIGKKVVLRLSEISNAKVIVLNTHPGAIGFYNRIKEYRRNKYVFEKMITSDTTRQMSPEKLTAMFTPKGYRFPEEYE